MSISGSQGTYFRLTLASLPVGQVDAGRRLLLLGRLVRGREPRSGVLRRVSGVPAAADRTLHREHLRHGQCACVESRGVRACGSGGVRACVCARACLWVMWCAFVRVWGVYLRVGHGVCVCVCV